MSPFPATGPRGPPVLQSGGPPPPDTMTAPGPDVTVLFARMRAGDEHAMKAIVDALYKDLHRIASGQMRKEAKPHTLQSTALLNEAWLRLLKGPDEVRDRHHLFALAAKTMRQVLVDHARARRARKRGGGVAPVTLDDIAGQPPRLVDVLVVDQALTALAAENARAATVVELQFFGGHTHDDIAGILDVSVPTVRRAWEDGKRFLKQWMVSGPPAGG